MLRGGCFQFLGIPPKGEPEIGGSDGWPLGKDCFQFLGIPPKGELRRQATAHDGAGTFPISRDPPEGGTLSKSVLIPINSSFQFLGIPPKGELSRQKFSATNMATFPISRDPPEGGTSSLSSSISWGSVSLEEVSNF